MCVCNNQIATFKPILKKQSSPRFHVFLLLIYSALRRLEHSCLSVPVVGAGGLPAVNYEPVLCLQD